MTEQEYIKQYYAGELTEAAREVADKEAGVALAVTGTNLEDYTFPKTVTFPAGEKSVKFASEAGVGRKVQYDLTVRYNGGDNEGTDKWTYNGSTSKSVNITPDKIQG